MVDAELISAREYLAGSWLQTWRAAMVAASIKPGQYVHLAGLGPPGSLPLRRPVAIASIDRARGEVTLDLPSTNRATVWLAMLRPQDRVHLIGPLGRPLAMDPRAHHLLLIAEGLAVPPLRPLAEAAIADGRQVALLVGARSAADVYPSSLLPDEIEYVVATGDGSMGHRGSVVELVAGYEAWADQAVASGGPALLERLARVARGRDGRLGVARLGRRTGGRRRGTGRGTRHSWLSVLLEQRVGCALGVCLGCVVPGASGPVRVCREGPSFAADEIAWGEPA